MTFDRQLVFDVLGARDLAGDPLGLGPCLGVLDLYAALILVASAGTVGGRTMNGIIALTNIIPAMV